MDSWAYCIAVNFATYAGSLVFLGSWNIGAYGGLNI